MSRVDRTCPRCHANRYHHVETPDPLPAKVRIVCAECSHRWTGRLTRAERDLPDVAAPKPRTPGTTNAPGGKWHATPASARKARPANLTLTPEARAALDALVRRAGPRTASAEVSAAIVERAERMKVPIAEVGDP